MIYHKTSDPSFFSMLFRGINGGEVEQTLEGHQIAIKNYSCHLLSAGLHFKFHGRRLYLSFTPLFILWVVFWFWFWFFSLLLCNAKHTGREVCVFGCQFTLKTNKRTRNPPPPPKPNHTKSKIRTCGRKLPLTDYFTSHLFRSTAIHSDICCHSDNQQ